MDNLPQPPPAPLNEITTLPIQKVLHNKHDIDLLDSISGEYQLHNNNLFNDIRSETKKIGNVKSINETEKKELKDTMFLFGIPDSIILKILHELTQFREYSFMCKKKPKF